MPTRGRPPGSGGFRPTAAQAQRAEELIAAGMGERDIARAFGIALETARKYYGEQFRDGRAKKRAEVIGLLFQLARKGNVSACKHLEAMTGLSVVEAEFAGKAEPAKKPPRLGKKEQANIEAETAEVGTAWAELLN